MITTLINDETFLSDVSADSWEELVDVAGEPLVRQGSVEPGFLASIKDTIVKYGPYMVLVDDIALLDGRPEAGVHEIAMSLALLHRPVYLDEKRVKAAFVFAAVDHDSHLELLQELAHALADDELLELLRNNGGRSDIMRRFESAEDQNEIR
jgi:mannitol/fructose-specific phosphotransferase system IIA component (Ntr-type)